MIAVFLAILVTLGCLIAGGLLADRIEAFMRRRVSNCTVEGNSLLLWGLLILAAFVFGLIVMYLVR
jgi:uncharacterized BrkB/YihY/UPF0761 family membrane protein